MYRILQQPEGDDYVLATGETHSVREFVELAFAEIGRIIEWHGEGVNEVGIDRKSGQTLVRVDPRYFRPTEVDLLLGNPAKAKEKLGWVHTTSFFDLVKEMVAADLKTKIFVAGHRGMVGAAVVRRLSGVACTILTASRDELDLRSQADVRAWMRAHSPDVVILAAAKVGGILANDTYPADFLYENLAIEVA
eukprot:gene3891-5142_t